MTDKQQEKIENNRYNEVNISMAEYVKELRKSLNAYDKKHKRVCKEEKLAKPKRTPSVTPELIEHQNDNKAKPHCQP